MKACIRIALLSVLMFLYYVVVVVAQQPASQPATKPTTEPNAKSSANLPPTTLPVPSIPDAHRAEFFHCQLDLARAQTAFQSAVELLSRDCGEKFLPQVNQAGDPVCAPRAEIPATKPATQPAEPKPNKKK
jgi:hypothetical protein